MSLEKQCRRKPDIEGMPVKLRGGEEWLIAKAELEPIFEREDGQWILKDLAIAEPYRDRFDRICQLWKEAAEEDSLPTELVAELQKATLELAAMALDQNYDLTPEQLGKLIDPLDQIMSMSILAALRQRKLGGKGSDGEPEKDEKKNS